MHARSSISFLALTILSAAVGCEAIARVDRENIPGEGGGSQSSSSSSGQIGCLLDSDCPATGNDCTVPSCNATQCTTTVEAAGTACANGNGKVCDGLGNCVECLTEADCPQGTACQTRVCSARMCGFSNAAPGTKISDPTAGDCKSEQCDAAGQVVTGNDDTDVPTAPNQCKTGACSMGTPSTPDLPEGTACGVMNTICDGMGNCVGCTMDAHCGPPTECNAPTCVAMTCTDNFVAEGTQIMAQTANDCVVTECDGMGGLRQVPDAMDLPLDDDNPCTEQACDVGMPIFPPSVIGKACNQNGGKVCDGNGACVECNVGGECASTICAMNVCQPPEVVSIVPTNAATNISVANSIAIMFSGTMDPTTLIGQTSVGPCSGSIQLSVDDFTTCYPFASALPTMTPDNKTATVVPAPGFSYGTTYKVRVTTGAKDQSGKALAMNYTQPMGFATEVPPSSCAGSIVISQVYASGGLAGAAYAFDYVELHNRGNTPVDVTGWTVQYASATGTTWSGPTLSGIMAPGGYYLIQLGTNGSVGAMLPTPNLVGTNNLSPTAGKLALVTNATFLMVSCPMGGAVMDFVGYGATANCAEGPMPANAPTLTQALFRKAGGCVDSVTNSVDTELLNAAPRNGMTPTQQCDCPVGSANGTTNESDIPVEMDFCNVQFPTTIQVTPGQMTPPIYGRVYEPGFTPTMGANALITAEVGVGPANVNPEYQSGYQFFPATFNVQVGNDDEYMATFAAPMTTGSFRYVYRFTRDGLSWTYCDKNGSGSNAGLSFEIHELPILTVMP